MPIQAGDPQIHVRNDENNGFDEVNGAAAIRGVIGAEPVTEYKDASFTAVVGRSYNVNEVGTPVVVTSPSGTEGASFNVFVQGGTVNVGGVNYTDGQTIKAHYVGGGWEYNLISAESAVGTALVTAASESAARDAIGVLSPYGTIIPAVAPENPVDPLDLTFTVKRVGRKFGFLDENFILGTERFITSNTSEWRVGGTSSDSRVSLDGRFVQTAGAGSPNFVGIQFQGRLKIPFAGIEVPILSRYAAGASRQIQVGFGSDITSTGYGAAANAIIVSIDDVNDRFFASSYAGGANQNIGVLLNGVPSGPFTMGVAMVDTSICLWTKEPGGEWIFKGSVQYTPGSGNTPDVRNPSILEAMSPFAVFVGYSGNTYEIGEVRWGYLAGVAAANMWPLIFEDGTPLVYGNKLYLMGNNPHPVGVSSFGINIRSQTTEIYEMDLGTYSLVNIGKIAVKRGGKIYGGDCSGQVLYDRQAKLWRYFLPDQSSTAAVNSQSQTPTTYQYTTNYFPRGVIVLDDPVAFATPSPYGSADDAVVKIGNEWWTAYSTWPTSSYTNPQRTGLAKGTSLSALTLVAVTPTLGGGGAGEGCKIVKIGGVNYVLTTGDGVFRVYDMTLTQLGTITDPLHNNAAVGSHPSIVQVPMQDGSSKFLLIGFSGSGYGVDINSWGSYYIAEAAQTQDGFDYPFDDVGRIPGIQGVAGTNWDSSAGFLQPIKKSLGDKVPKIAVGADNTITAGSGYSVVLTNSGTGVAQALILPPLSNVSPVIEFKDLAGTPNRWWVGSGAASGSDGVFFVYDRRQAVMRLQIDTSGNVIVPSNGRIRFNSSTGPLDFAGSGTPEGSLTAPVGSTFRRTDGGTGTSFYVKESGTGNTGWVAK
jgi:hypothetical protein